MYSSNKSQIWSLDERECLAARPDNITLCTDV
jgi:hypothetical protein